MKAMRIQKTTLGILLCLVSIVLNAQELSQVIRGQVIDAESQTPLPFASVAIITTDPLLGAITDDNGNFRLNQVPIGRHNMKISYVGYETQMIPELMVTTGKEIVLTIKIMHKIKLKIRYLAFFFSINFSPIKTIFLY